MYHPIGKNRAIHHDAAPSCLKAPLRCYATATIGALRSNRRAVEFSVAFETDPTPWQSRAAKITAHFELTKPPWRGGKR